MQITLLVKFDGTIDRNRQIKGTLCDILIYQYLRLIVLYTRVLLP